MNQREFREGLEKGKQLVIEFLEEIAVKVESVSGELCRRRS